MRVCVKNLYIYVVYIFKSLYLLCSLSLLYCSHSIEGAKVTYDTDDVAHTGEGRVITIELPKFFLVTLYVPNSG